MTTTKPSAVSVAYEDDAGCAFPTLMEAVNAVLRIRGSVELSQHAVDGIVDAFTVATCRACHRSWAVDRARFTEPESWMCPQHHRRPAVKTDS